MLKTAKVRVKDLLEALKTMPQEAEVRLYSDGCWRPFNCHRGKPDRFYAEVGDLTVYFGDVYDDDDEDVRSFPCASRDCGDF